MSVDLHHFAALQEANAGYWFGPDGILHGERVVTSLIPENTTQPRIRPRSLIRTATRAAARPAGATCGHGSHARATTGESVTSIST